MCCSGEPDGYLRKQEHADVPSHQTSCLKQGPEVKAESLQEKGEAETAAARRREGKGMFSLPSGARVLTEQEICT